MKVDDKHTKDRILKIAKAMMLEYGLKGVNMNKLAKESGVAKATLYKIIGSKEELITTITVDFFAETFGQLFESILCKNSFSSITNSDIEEIASLAIGKMRVIHRQVFLEYPLIEKQVSENMDNYAIRIEEKFRNLQDAGEVTKAIIPKNVFRFYRMLFMQLVISPNTDSEVKQQMNEMYLIFLRGLKA